jgi:branched-chain amino acid transport system permease protein
MRRIPAWVTRLVPIVTPAAITLAIQLIFFPVPAGVWVEGLIVGGLTALVALGMALIYRTNRILNFAQGDMGAVPTVLVVLLITNTGLNYFLALSAGLAASLVLGAGIELIVIRRFFRAPRLLLSVATIGLAQVLSASAILLPRAWNTQLLAPTIAPPFHFTFVISPLVFNANDLIALIAFPVLAGAVAWFLYRTHVGVALRAAADSGDRASMLGIPVSRLQTVVWALAGLLAFIAIFLRTGVLGLPVGETLGFAVLLRALAALFMGRLTCLSGVVLSGISLGVLELGVTWNEQSPLLVDPVLAGAIALSLIVMKPVTSRADRTEVSSWEAAEEPRPIPDGLRSLLPVRVTRLAAWSLLVGLALLLPNLLSVDRSLKASAVLIYAILGLSLVVLTGWAGQVSLGQVAFFALGAALGAKITSSWHMDLIIAFALTALAGAVAAVIVGLPALRLRGLYLAVITFAFSLAVTSWLLNPSFFSWIPQNQVGTPPLFGRLSLDTPTRMYYLALASLVAMLVLLRGVRHSRTGRALIALRENEDSAAAFGIEPVRLKLTAFAMSGAIAAFAGCLFVHQQQAFGSSPYQPGENLGVFALVVVGGVASLSGAVLGALYLRGCAWLLPGNWQLVASGAAMLLILMVAPYGLSGILTRVRDLWLRWIAGRHGIDIPTLTADRRLTSGLPSPAIVSGASR